MESYWNYEEGGVLDLFSNGLFKGRAKYHHMRWLNRSVYILPFILIAFIEELGLSFHSFKKKLPPWTPYFLFLCFIYSFFFWNCKTTKMLFSSFILLALGSAGISTCATIPERAENALRQLENRQNQAANGKCLATNLTQSASSKTGQEPGTDGIKPGQAPSAT